MKLNHGKELFYTLLTDAPLFVGAILSDDYLFMPISFFKELEKAVNSLEFDTIQESIKVAYNNALRDSFDLHTNERHLFRELGFEAPAGKDETERATTARKRSEYAGNVCDAGISFITKNGYLELENNNTDKFVYVFYIHRKHLGSVRLSPAKYKTKEDRSSKLTLYLSNQREIE